MKNKTTKISSGKPGEVKPLKPSQSTTRTRKPKRVLGQGSGKFWIAPDFDEPDEATKQMLNGRI